MNIECLQEAAATLRDILPQARPCGGIVLGSGWNTVRQAFEVRHSLSYTAIPGWGQPGPAGHTGRLSLVQQSGMELFLFEGRRHWYEGAGWEPVAMPVFLLHSYGAHFILLTNAAGGIRSDLQAGDLMVIDDHINAMGANPLVGPLASCWGQRFPDMSCVYDRGLRERLDSAGRETATPLAHGTYLAVSGPAYETPAEIRAYRSLGADAIGMSTVPEAILAHAAGLHVAAISCIANAAAGRTSAALSHSDVLLQTQRSAPRMRDLLVTFVRGLAAETTPLAPVAGGKGQGRP